MQRSKAISTIVSRWTEGVGVLACAAALIVAPDARAAGTAAGTAIDNTASVTFTRPDGSTGTAVSNPVTLRVDEVLDVTVVTGDTGNVATAPGATDAVTSFVVTNTGNGTESFALSTVNAVGGDNFDPTTVRLVLDLNNNGILDEGPGATYVPGSNDPVLAPDASVRVFVVSGIPSGATDGQTGRVELVATATTGTGPAGTVFPGLGDGGADAVAGLSGATARDDGTYIVQATTIALAKTATVADPFGGSRVVPGSIITYTLTATTSGSGALNGVAISDPVPANTTFVGGSITSDGVAQSDAAGDDAGQFATNTVTVTLGSVPAGQTRVVTFRTRVN